MNSSITTPRISQLLDTLYADAATNDPLARKAANEQIASGESEADYYRAMRLAYLPVNRPFGNLLYTLARSIRAETIVEFGTSFGVSTIFLASAVRDNDSGRVVTVEFNPEKSVRARENLAAAGLEEWVEFRVGDALETFKTDPPSNIDLVFLDGAKGLYLPVLKLLEPHLQSGAIIASDNTDHEGMETFLDYLRTPANGYTSTAVLTPGGQTNRGHEVTIRH